MKKRHPEEKELTPNEIRSEFQLERMVLFSDAVFAIVITLMAIELKLPESAIPITTNEGLNHELKHLVPVFIAYMISFGFIGTIWFRHLKLFSRLKDYDTGLVVRNLFLLFFIGLFPFGASLIMKYKGLTSSLIIYISLIVLTIGCQQVLQYYVYVLRPNLRRNISVVKEVQEVKAFNVTVAGFFVTLVTMILSSVYMIKENDIVFIFSGGVLLTAILTRIARYHYIKKLPTS